MNTNKKRSFGIGHFPIGTMVRIQVFPNKPVIETMVTRLSSNGPNSWVIETTEPANEHIGGFFTCNIDHVIEIVKRGPGDIKITDPRMSNSTKFKSDIFNRNGNLKPEYGIQKHHSQFLAFSGSQEIVYAIAMDIANPTMLLDNEKLVGELIKGGHLPILHTHTKNSFHSNGFHWSYVQINKKRLKKAIKRVIGKAYINRKHAQKVEDEEMMKRYYEDFESDFGINHISDTEDFECAFKTDSDGSCFDNNDDSIIV